MKCILLHAGKVTASLANMNINDKLNKIRKELDLSQNKLGNELSTQY